MKKKVSTIIVNYKTPHLVIDCLESLSVESYPDIDFQVFVIDNNSDDNSYDIMSSEVIKRGWDSWVSLSTSVENGGFSFGNNVLIKKVMNQKIKTDYIWLLNPDTYIRKYAYKELVTFLNDNPKVGIAGSRLEDPDSTPQVSAFRDFTVISEMLLGFQFSLLSKLFSKWIIAGPISSIAHKTSWVSGASMMVKREVFEKIGLLDENYFLYYEEVDFCLRARRSGWECWTVPKSRVVHLEGAATGISDLRKKAPRRPTYWFESRRFFFLKNYGWLKLLTADILWMFGYSTWIIRKKIQKKPDIDPPHFLKDFFRNSIIRKGIRY